MELERRVLKENVAEEYRILLRAEAELFLPCDYPRIREFYLTLADACLKWTTEVSGARLRTLYTSLESNTEKARFRTYTYRFRMRYPLIDGRCAAIVCESDLEGEAGGGGRRRLSHVWYLKEETMLPPSQILKLYSCGGRIRGIGFRPDGIYPEDGKLVFFKNLSEKGEILEKYCAFDMDGNL